MKKFGAFLRRNIVWIPLLIVISWTTVPLIWSFASSFKTPADFATIPPPFFATEWTLEGYQKVIATNELLRYRFWTFVTNSLVIAVASTLIAISLSTLAAYGFARYKFRWRSVLLILALIPRLVPRVSLIVPIADIIRSVPGLHNTHLALIIVYSGAAIPLATWIMIGFIRAIPRELDEAAKIDGATTLQTFSKIVLPLSIPGLLTVAVMSFRDAWNEFPFALALTSGPRTRTLPYQLFLLKDTLGIIDFGSIQAFTMLTILPLIILYVRFEKHVVAGMTASAVK